MLMVKDLKQILEDYDDDRYVYVELNPVFPIVSLNSINGYKKDRHGDLRFTINEIQKEV